MTRQRVLLQPAYVLHQRAYRNTSAILELFTPEHGRVGVVAKGVRGQKPRWPGLLQAFQPLLVSWNQGGELGLLTTAEAQGTALTISPQFIASGFYLNEILLRLLQRNDAQLEVFGWYDAALRELSGLGTSAEQSALEITLRRFEMRLLSALGYGLVLDHDVLSSVPVQADQQYVYHLEQGPTLVDEKADEKADDRNFDERSTESFGVPVSGQALLAMQADDFSLDATRREAKHLLRAVLGAYLGTKPLASRQLMLQCAQLAQRVAQ